MLASSGALQNALIGVVVGLVVLLVGYVARSSGGWWGRRSTEDHAQKTQSDYLFGTSANETARTPATVGWITTVDARIENIDRKLDQVIGVVNSIKGDSAVIVHEVTPNGGENLRGSADKAAGKA